MIDASKREAGARQAQTGSENVDLRAANDIADITKTPASTQAQNPAAVAGAIADLTRQSLTSIKQLNDKRSRKGRTPGADPRRVRRHFFCKAWFRLCDVINNIAAETDGLCMSQRDLPRRLSPYGASVDLQRIALTYHDLNGGLPSFSADSKSKDPRYRWFVENYGRECCELDAVPPPDLRQRVRDAILSYIDIETWDHCARLEAVERDSLRSFKWDRAFSDQAHFKATAANKSQDQNSRAPRVLQGGGQ